MAARRHCSQMSLDKTLMGAIRITYHSICLHFCKKKVKILTVFFHKCIFYSLTFMMDAFALCNLTDLCHHMLKQPDG